MMRKRLGELLIEAGLIDEYQLQSALGHQRQWGGRLGQILVHMKFVDEDRMVRVLSTQLGVPVADAPPDDLHVRVLGEISLELAQQHHIFPIAIRRDAKGDQLAVAMTDPSNVAAIDAVQFTSGKKIVPFLAGDTAIETWIRRHYHGERVVQSSGTAATVSESSAQMSVQFGGQLVDLGAAADDDDIPVVTGAMVAAPATTMSADPFAGLAPTSVPVAMPTPSGRFAAPVAVPGVATHASFAGTGLATLDPLTSAADHDAWTQNVELAAAAAPSLPLPLPPPTSSPSFGPSGGFLGSDDDTEGAPPTSSPDPFAALAPAAAVVVDPFANLAALTPPVFAPPAVEEPVMDLEVLDLTEAAPEPTPVVEAPAATPVAAPVAAPATIAAPSPGPSWGDLLDATPAPRRLDSIDIDIAVEPPFEPVPPETASIDAAPVEAAPVVEPMLVEDVNPFARGPITADAFPPMDFASPASTLQAPTALVSVVESAPPVVVVDDAACPRCANARVESARFCPFCGLSFVGVPLASGVVPVQSEFSGHADLDIDINEPSGPQAAAPGPDIAAVVEDAVALPARAPIDVVADDLGFAAIDVVDDVVALPASPVTPPLELSVDDIGLAPVGDIGLSPVGDIGLAPVDDSGLTPVEAVAVDIDVAVDIEVPVDAPLELAADAIGLVAVDDGAVAVDVGVDDDGAQARADAEAASLAMQWADAAERQIPRKETDTRNDLGWVPPSRELVVTPEPAAPAPEPIVAYTPAAPPVMAPVAAPWAVFAPTLVPVEPKPAPPTAVAPVNEAWVVASSSGPVPVAAHTAAELIAEPLMAPLSDPSPEPLDEPLDVTDAVEPLDVVDDVTEHAHIAAPPVLAAEPAPLSTMVGWGDLVDDTSPSATSSLPPPILPTISVPFMPPATLTPPPMSFVRAPTVDGLMAPPALSAPLVPPSPTWPTSPHDDPFAAALDATSPMVAEEAVAPKPQKVTATMVMKLDPAEQKRLLAMLLANSEISADVLAAPKRPSDGDPDKGS